MKSMIFPGAVSREYCLRLSLPLMVGQFINVLYSIVDRMLHRTYPGGGFLGADRCGGFLSDHYGCHGICLSDWNRRAAALLHCERKTGG